MKSIMVSAAALAVTIGLTGCVSTGENVKTYAPSETNGLTVILPAVNPSTGIPASSLTDVEAYFKTPHIRYIDRNGTQMYYGAFIDLTPNNQFSSTSFRCTIAENGCNMFYKTFKTITGNVSYDVSGKKLNLHLTAVNQKTESGMLNAAMSDKLTVDFEPTNLASAFDDTYVEWKYEIDSPYNVESVLGNFSRLSDSKLHTAKTATDVETFGKFGLDIGGSYCRLDVKAYPYHNGSKLIITGRVPGRVKGNVIDFTENAALLKDRIASIVKA